MKAGEETRRRQSVGNQLPKIPEEEEGKGNDFGTAISKDFGNGGEQSTLPEHQDTVTDAKELGDVDLGGGGDVIVGDFEEEVEEGRLN